MSSSVRHDAHRYDFVLVGGGLVGACLAEELAVGGASVLVADAGPEAGHATTRAAGVAVPSLRYLGDEFYDWLTTARRALEGDIERLEPGYGPFSLSRPIVRLLGEEDLRAMPGQESNPALGRPVDEPDLGGMAPGVRLPAGRRPFIVDDGLLVNGPAYLGAVRTSAISGGVSWRQNTTVTAVDDSGPGPVVIECEDGSVLHADQAVLTTGAWTGRFAPVPVGPQRGQLAVLGSAARLDCILSSRLYLSPLPGGGLVVGATEEDAGFTEHCTAGTAAGLLAFAVRTMPGLAEVEVTDLRAGLRPYSATGRPVVGRVPGRRRLSVAAGHAGHGLISSRLSARGLAAGLLHADWDTLPESFCPSRAGAAPAAAAATAATARGAATPAAGR